MMIERSIVKLKVFLKNRLSLSKLVSTLGNRDWMLESPYSSREIRYELPHRQIIFPIFESKVLKILSVNVVEACIDARIGKLDARASMFELRASIPASSPETFFSKFL